MHGAPRLLRFHTSVGITVEVVCRRNVEWFNMIYHVELDATHCLKFAFAFETAKDTALIQSRARANFDPGVFSLWVPGEGKHIMRWWTTGEESDAGLELLARQTKKIK